MLANKLNEYGSEFSHGLRLMVHLVYNAAFLSRSRNASSQDSFVTIQKRLRGGLRLAPVLAVGVKSVGNINMYLLCSHVVCNLTVLFGLDGHYMVTMAVKTLKKSKRIKHELC